MKGELFMNKLLQKVAKIFLGLSMAAGAGVAIAGNRDVTSVNATVGSDVTIGSGTYTSAYETGFENCTAGQTYNSTTPTTYNSTVGQGVSWSVVYGTVSTNDAITSSNSMQMRWYKTASTTYGHAETTSAKTNVAAFKFSYKVSNKNLKFDVYYGTNGSAWTKIETVTASSTSAATYSHEFDETVASFYMKVQVSSSGTAPSSGNYKFIIDDVVFGSPKAVACTVTLNKNGGSGGTDSVSATKDSAMPTLASAPTRTGYTFAGYYDDASAGTQYYTANRASARNWDKDGTTATLYAHWTANQYDINYYDQGDSAFSGSHESGYPTKHTYGTATTLKSATKGGYNFDGWFTTSECTGSAVTSLGATAYTAAIDLYAKWTATGTTYSISTTVTNGSYSGDTSITDNGGVASVTISPTGDFKLPASVSVSGADHTYNVSTGVISLSNATGNVTISAAMVALTEYSITVNETNGSHTGASTIKESRTASLTFTPASGYGQPSSVTVSGATSSWARGTGVLSLSNPTGNVTVTYTAVGNELDSISISANSGSYTLGDNFVMPTVTAKYTVNADADVTSSASYSGYDPYTTGNQPVTISYTEGGITKTASYTATVSAKQVTTDTTWTRVTSVNDLTAGTYIIGYESTAGSGTIVPLRSDGANATTSANGYFYTGTTADSSNSNTISIATNMTSTGYEFTVEKISSDVINIKNAAGNYLGATSGGTTSNKGRLYTSGNSNETNFTVSYSSDRFSMTAAVSGSYKYLKYNSGSPRYAVYNSSANDTSFYKKGTQSTGSASLIRIVAEYIGGDKYVGDTIYTTDFTVQKQLDTGTTLTNVTGFTINGESSYVLSSTSNNITVSYTEGGVTKTATVVVSATEREASLEHVVLNVGENAKLDEYVYWSGAEWDLTDITVTYDWDDDDFDETVNLQDLVVSGDATLSPATPTLGATSFTVSYSYLEKNIENATVTLDEAVVADYVSSVSWNGKSLANFKAFSGQELTASTVDSWTVKATYAGAGETNALSFGTGANQFTIRIGDSKAVNSLPYTWTTADDNQFVYVVVGGVAKGDSTYAKTNICATINAIDHSETSTGEIEKSVTWSKDDSIAAYGTTSLCEDGVALDENIFMQGAKGDAGTEIRFWSDGIRTYTGGNTLTFTPSNGAVITKITLPTVTVTSDSTSSASSPYTITGGDSAVVFDIGSKSTIGSDIVVEYTIEGSETTTVHYANDMDHFDAQKKVVEFAKFMNTTMNGTNVCSGTFANLESAWDDVAGKYDELFGASTTLSETELSWAKNMLKYATAAWGSDAEAACVEKAMKTYEHCVSHYDLDAFMSPVRSVSSVKVSPLVNIIGENTNTVAIIVIISMVSVTAIGGYFFLRKRKENN